MDTETLNALLRAVSTLIDEGRFELGKPEAETEEEQTVIDFMRALRQSSRVRYGGAVNTWNLDLPLECERCREEFATRACDGALRCEACAAG